jgi:hypothetical protein
MGITKLGLRQRKSEFAKRYSLFTDFIQSQNGGDGLTFNQTASGGNTASSTFESFPDSIDGINRPRLGVTQFRSGGVLGNQITWFYGSSAFWSLVSGFKELSFRMSFRLQAGALPTAVANWGFYLGFHDTATGANYLLLTNRFAVLRLPLIAETNFYRFEICNAGGASSIFNTNIPVIVNSYEDFEVSLKTSPAGVRRFEILYFGNVILTVPETNPNFPSNNFAQTTAPASKIRNFGGSAPANRIVLVDAAEITIDKI